MTTRYVPSKWFICLLGLAWPLGVAAHPFHISHAEAEWNAESHVLEVAVALDPHDLEAAVRAHAKVEGSLDEPTFETLLKAYVQAGFVVKADSAVFHWVGWEEGPKAVWVYFEVALAQPPTAQLPFSNRLLLESVAEQKNFLTVKVGTRAETRWFTAQQPWRTFQVGPNDEATPRRSDP